MKKLRYLLLALLILPLMGNDACDSANKKERQAVSRQQEIFVTNQPAPVFVFAETRCVQAQKGAWQKPDSEEDFKGQPVLIFEAFEEAREFWGSQRFSPPDDGFGLWANPHVVFQPLKPCRRLPIPQTCSIF
mgnify:CR=1 FL=1